MRLKVKVQVNAKNIEKDVYNRIEKAQFALDNQVLKDSNYFAPWDTQATIDSSFIHSKIGEGMLIWAVPYVRRIYYNPQFNFSKDKNPHAGGLWFEVAKSQFLSDWVKVANNAAARG